jgi:hypothetical protein
MAIGNQIQDTDYNSLQDSVQALLGTGSGSRGYGQPVPSSDVFDGNTITKAQWDALRNDILSVRVHQDGTTPTIASVAAGSPINFAIISNFSTILAVADANRFNIGAGQSVVSTKATQSTSSSWNVQAQAVLTVTFANSNDARYFFNSGGKIRVIGSRSGGSTTSQNNAWTNFLANIGTISFGAAASAFVNYYDLTTAYQTYYQTGLSTPYSANFYRLEANCDVADNSTGTATQVNIRITLRDDYTDGGFPPLPDDLVDGTLTLTIEELKAAGSLYPTGTFTITSPSYSLSSISLT